MNTRLTDSWKKEFSIPKRDADDMEVNEYMVIGIIGENCTGKSTLANEINKELGAEIISGKDYLRMAKSENEAEMLFKEKLQRAVTGDNIIYVIAEPELIGFLPEGTIKILVKADLDIIKERFRKRMHGNMSELIEMVLEKKHGMFDRGNYDYYYDGTSDNALVFCEELKKRIQAERQK